MAEGHRKRRFARLVAKDREEETGLDEPVLAAPMAVPFVATAKASGSGVAAETAYLFDFDIEPIEKVQPEVAEEPPPPVEEVLGDLSCLDRQALGRLRRKFAQMNHPDHPDGLAADVAHSRMSLANRLIDEALEKLT